MLLSSSLEDPKAGVAVGELTSVRHISTGGFGSVRSAKVRIRSLKKTSRKIFAVLLGRPTVVALCSLCAFFFSLGFISGLLCVDNTTEDPRKGR